MSQPVIAIENLAKEYRLGGISHRMLTKDLQSWFARLCGREDPNAPLEEGQVWREGTTKDRFWALRDVSFSVNEGEVVGIIGRNGAGKSTLLKILSRITTPTCGVVKIRGRVTSLLEVGTGFHPELTGRENIYLNGAIHGMNKAEIRLKLDEIISFAEIEPFIDTPVKRYSSGMYVRLAFAVAAHLEPEILVVDEILAVGDVQFQKKCLGKMEAVGREGRTVLFVSHNMSTIKALCNRCLVLEKGETCFDGDVQQAIARNLSSLDSDVTRVPVADRKREPKCSLRAKIVDVSVRSGNIENPVELSSSAIVSVRLTVEARTALKCSAQLVVRDEMQPLSYLDSGVLHQKIYCLPQGKSTIQCNLGPLHLYAGRYWVDCGLNIPFNEVIDEVQEVYSFEVRECDPYSSGYNIEKKHGFGLFHIPHSWS